MSANRVTWRVTWPFLGAVVFAAVLLSGCATWPQSERPVVAIAAIEPVDIGVLSQQFRVRLRILNRAETPLEIRGVVFDVDINGERFAKGAGPVQASVARYASTVVEAEAISTLASMARQIRGLGTAIPRARLSYRIYGRIDLPDGRSVPFDDRGDLAP